MGLGAFFVVLFLFEIYLPKSFIKSDKVEYVLEKGTGANEIANDLKRKGVIKNAQFFKFYVLVSLNYSKLQAGKYELSESMSVADIADKFARGDIIKNKIIIIEGWSIEDLTEYLESNKTFEQDDFYDALKKDYSGEFMFLKERPKAVGYEGYIFPDTYYISQETTTEDFLKIALSNFDKKMSDELRQEIKKQGKSIFKIVTMASMLEKEVKTIEDKKIVSGILWKRIKEGIPLQVDATVNYATGKSDEKVTIKDTKVDSLYNTYKYYGLPLGPISNPGLDSILAAIYPEESPYWYYLSADGNGQTIFSKTLDEHNEARAKYFK